MSLRHVIVDGSNLATEGRNMPSLAQLDQAVREFMSENPDDVVTVVVDASFGHRIDPSELPTFEEAEVAGEVISPPAGAIGRGDAFLLRIAEKIGATVLSNDSFQEFHGEHVWLFEKGRLVGGKPVPGVGWIFMERTPVRGHKSREVVKEAKRKKRTEVDGTPAAERAAAAAPAETKARESATARAKARPKAVDRAIARATQEVVEPKADGKGRRRRGGQPPAEAVNEPLAFITFIAAHPLGSQVIGVVVEYSSHGAFIDADGARCYMPLSAMSEPAPRRAREVVSKGEDRAFVVQAFDPQRRGIELALPGFAKLAGGPTAETVEAEIRSEAAPPRPPRRRKAALVPAGLEPIPPAVVPDLVPVLTGSAPARRSRKAAKPGGEETAAAAPAKSAAAKVPAKRAAKVAAATVEVPASQAAQVPAKKAAATKAARPKVAAPKVVATKAAAPEVVAPKKAGAKKAGVSKKTGASKVPSSKQGAALKSASPPKRSATGAGGAKQAGAVQKGGAVQKVGAAQKTAPPEPGVATNRKGSAKSAAPRTAAATKVPAPRTAAATKTPAPNKASAARSAGAKAAGSNKAAASRAAGSAKLETDRPATPRASSRRRPAAPTGN
jgi:hypothetical protein